MPKSAVVLAAVVAALLGACPALSATYTVHVTNISDEKIIGIKVMGRGRGEVIGFRPTTDKEFRITVELPDDGVCNPVLRFNMSSFRRIEGRVPVCSDAVAVKVGFPWDY